MRFNRRGNPSAEMPFLDHLEELRWRILWSLLALAIGSGLGIWLVIHFNVLGLLIKPITPFLGGTKLGYLGPTDPFFITIKLGLTVGIILAFPVVVYEIWAFVGPALTRDEKRAIVPSLYLGLVLFLVGVALAYFFALPMTLRFTMSFQTESLQQNLIADNYLAFVVKLLVAFGAAFELPVVVLVLSAMGLITSRFLSSKRRYAIVGMAVLSALLTPGDVITLTIAMMLPLMFLYELSIFLAKLMERRRERALAAVPEPS